MSMAVRAASGAIVLGTLFVVVLTAVQGPDAVPDLAAGAALPILVALILQKGDNSNDATFAVIVSLLAVANGIFADAPPQPWLAFASVIAAFLVSIVHYTSA